MGVKSGCQALVITTGTFLNGLIHVGPDQRPAGRAGEPPSQALAESMKSFGFCWGRLKTGTPPRLGPGLRSISTRASDEVCSTWNTETRSRFRSRSTTDRTLVNRISCWLLHTTTRSMSWCGATSRSRPCSTGKSSGIGPRYCPSLEDKVMRFPDRERHQLFLEPEGVAAREIYLNGYSMSLPADVQERAVHALPGLESATLLRPGYAIEYDFIQPTELSSSLRRTACPGCFSPVRSTEPLDTKRPLARDWSPASMPREAPRACRPWSCGAIRPISAS